MKLHESILRTFTKKRVLIAFILASIAQAYMLMVQTPAFFEVSEGMKMLDLLQSYNQDYILELFTTLGSKGRELYLSLIRVDFVYAVLAAFSYTGILVLLLKPAQLVKPLFVYLASLGLLYGVGDVLENISNVILLNSFPEVNSIWVTASIWGNKIKYSMMYFAMLFILIEVIAILVAIIKKRARKSK